MNIQLQAELEGALIDCGCCCSPFAFELLVQCSEGYVCGYVVMVVYVLIYCIEVYARV